MKVNRPIIKILKNIKTKDGNDSLLNIVIKHLYDVEKVSVVEIATVLEISISSIYKALKKDSS